MLPNDPPKPSTSKESSSGKKSKSKDETQSGTESTGQDQRESNSAREPRGRSRSLSEHEGSEGQQPIASSNPLRPRTLSMSPRYPVTRDLMQRMSFYLPNRKIHNLNAQGQVLPNPSTKHLQPQENPQGERSTSSSDDAPAPHHRRSPLPKEPWVGTLLSSSDEPSPRTRDPQPPEESQWEAPFSSSDVPLPYPRPFLQSERHLYDTPYTSNEERPPRPRRPMPIESPQWDSLLSSIDEPPPLPRHRVLPGEPQLDRLYVSSCEEALLYNGYSDLSDQGYRDSRVSSYTEALNLDTLRHQLPEVGGASGGPPNLYSLAVDPSEPNNSEDQIPKWKEEGFAYVAPNEELMGNPNSPPSPAMDEAGGARRRVRPSEAQHGSLSVSEYPPPPQYLGRPRESSSTESAEERYPNAYMDPDPLTYSSEDNSRENKGRPKQEPLLRPSVAPSRWADEDRTITIPLSPLQPGRCHQVPKTENEELIPPPKYEPMFDNPSTAEGAKQEDSLSPGGGPMSPRRFGCAWCGKMYVKRHHLKYHELKHNQRDHFQCKVCRCTFRTYQQFKQHLEPASTDSD